MRLAIRADASDSIGIGHVMRCLSLADANLDAGGRSLFVMRDLPGSAGANVRARQHDVALLPSMADDETTDAVETKRCVDEWGGADAVVVDHYELAVAWEKEFVDGRPVIALGGWEYCEHQVSLLHDQTYRSGTASRWPEFVPANTRLLLGPGVALLRREFREARSASVQFSTKVRRVLITLGGAAGRSGILAQTLEVALQVLPSGVALDIVSPMQPGEEERRMIEQRGSSPIFWHRDPADVASLMARADLAITGGGVSALEALCLGRPLITLSWAENQVAATRHLIDDGYCLAGGDGSPDQTTQLKDAIDHVITDAGLRRDLSHRGQRLVDGLGPQRVLQELEGAGDR
jgi:UDP-2,4-diacetamido-2,4,6-trideoxy-beta-L-altropyranose hydrolase